MVFYVSDGLNSNEYKISLSFNENFGLIGGSYGVLPARLLGLSYPDYLRLCRDTYGAELRGKAGYSYAVFKNKELAHQLTLVLNKELVKVEKFLLANIKIDSGAAAT